MRMWPKSHIELKDHNQKFNEGNLLTRGQTVEEVPENERHQYCNCIGSNGYVHFKCLEKWICGNNYKKKCEICNSNYVPHNLIFLS